MKHALLALLDIGRTYQYASYVLRHKWFVFRAGMKLTDTWHELLLCALHDNNKFNPVMWIPYARYFYHPDGTSTTTRGPDGFQIYPKPTLEFNRAWLWHIKRSKHHPQHWVQVDWVPCGHVDEVLLRDAGDASCLHPGCGWKGEYTAELASSVLLLRPPALVVIFEMPRRYVTEMLCDWIGAGQAQRNKVAASGLAGETAVWYKTRGYKLPLGPMTRALVQRRLGIENWTPVS